MTLLQTAKKATASKRQHITDEHIELARAFVEGKIGLVAVNKALGLQNTSVQGYITIARAIREDYTQTQSQKDE